MRDNDDIIMQPRSHDTSGPAVGNSAGAEVVHTAEIEADMDSIQDSEESRPSATISPPHKRSIECCSISESSARSGDRAVACCEDSFGLQPAKRMAMAPTVAPQVPRLWPPASVGPNAALEQQAALIRMLHSVGLHLDAVLSVEQLGMLLPLLPGGSLPSCLSALLHKHLLAMMPTAAQLRVVSSGRNNELTVDSLVRFFRLHLAGVPVEGRLMPCLSGGARSHVSADDLMTVVQQVIDHHSGLAFLRSEPQFRQRYAETVVVRIFYELDPLRCGKIFAAQLRRSQFLDVLLSLEREAHEGSESVNNERRYFSYEHFYVIFCHFCKLDEDRDQHLALEDLLRYGDHMLSRRICHRIISSRVSSTRPGLIDYVDFVWFILSEEDKTSRTATSYWFRLLDLDGDGEISTSEMEHFYHEQAERQRTLSQEAVAFRDALCQLLDAVHPRQQKGSITLSDLRRCKMCPLVVHTLCNLNKFLAGDMHEMHATRDSQSTKQLTEWDRWAVAEYCKLSLEDDDDDDDGESDDDDDIEDQEEADPKNLFLRPSCFMFGSSGAAESPF